MATIYDVGDSVRLTGTFTDAAGDVQDPTAVYLEYTDPSENKTELQYGVDDEVVQASKGIYYVDVDADEIGAWTYRWYSTGTGQASESGAFGVTEAAVVGGITRTDLRERLARKLGCFFEGIATDGSTTTVIDTSVDSQLLSPDNYFINRYAYIRTDAGCESSAPEGEDRPISDSVQSTQILTVSPAFSAAVAAGDEFDIYPYPSFQLDAAISEGLYNAFPYWYREVRDVTSLDTTTSQFYTLPAACAELIRVGVIASDGYTVETLLYWKAYGTPGNMTLYLRESQSSGNDMELVYLEMPGFYTAVGGTVTTNAGTDILNVSLVSTSGGTQHTYSEACAEYVLTYAASTFMRDRMGRGSEGEGKDAINKLQYYREELVRLQRTMRMPPKSAPVHLAPWAGRSTKFGS